MRPSSSPFLRAAPLAHGGLLWLAAVTVAALLLYGCGGSGATREASPPADTTVSDTAGRPLADSVAADSAASDSAAGDTTLADSLTSDSVRTDTLQSGDTDAPTGEDEPAEQRPAFVDADSLSAFTQEGERIQDLFGDVFVRQDSTRLRSRYARRYLQRDEFLFANNVVIFERGDTLYADTVRYDKNRKIGRARGNVRLTDGDVVVRAPRAIYYAQEKRSVFLDSVVLVDSNRVLRAQEGEYFSDEDRAEFAMNVRMTDPDTYMEADSVTYLREDETSIARGNVFIERNPRSRRSASEDTTSRTFLFGRRARNEEPRRLSRIVGDALLVRIRTDSAGTPSDTLVVSAREMEASRRDTLNRLIAVDSVRIWQPDLAALADSAVYDRIEPREEPPDPFGPLQPDRPENPLLARVFLQPLPDFDALLARGGIVGLDGQPVRPARPSRVEGRTADGLPVDSVGPGGRDSTQALTEGDSTPAGADSTSASVPPREESRLYQNPVAWFSDAQVTGDTIRVLARNRSIDTVFVRSQAFVAQEDTAVGKIQQLTGKTITAIFKNDDLDRIIAEPNARAIRFLVDNDGKDNGAAKPSGDRIVIRFVDGQVDRVSVLGGVQSQYYQPGDVPEPFQLDGFSWTPERKPTRDGLLSAPRVRDRLNLDAPPDTTRPDIGRPAVADTLRARPGGEGRPAFETPAQQTTDTAAPETVLPDTTRRRPRSSRSPAAPDTTQAAPSGESRVPGEPPRR